MSTAAVQEHGVAHHEDGHEHHHDTFLTKYIFSQDHKMIAKQFLITGITMAFIAMTLSILFRIQLAYPDKAFPFLNLPLEIRLKIYEYLFPPRVHKVVRLVSLFPQNPTHIHSSQPPSTPPQSIGYSSH